MTAEDLKKESFFQQLADGNKRFVLARCEGKDSKEAAKAAWRCKDDASAIAQANRALKNANVVWCINRFFGVGPSRSVPDVQEAASWCWQKAQSSPDPELALKYAQLAFRVLGLETRPAENTRAAAPANTLWDEVRAIESTK